MPEVKLIQESHQYLVDSKPCQSTVTRELDKAGLSKYWNKDEWYMGRGRAVHTATHLIDTNQFSWDTVDPEIRGFLDGYFKFKEETKIEFLHREVSLYDPIYQYCGTPDAFFPLVDIKTGEENEVQLGGYWQLLIANELKPPKKEAYSLRLFEDGKYQFTPVKDIKLLSQVFLSALIVNRYRENSQKGYKENNK